MTDPIAYLGPRLKEIRMKTGISLRELARQLNVSPSFISQLENGKSQPSVATLYALAKLFSVPVDVLFENAGNPVAARRSQVTPESIVITLRLLGFIAEIRALELSHASVGWSKLFLFTSRS